MERKRLVVSYENLPTEVIEAINRKYPDGHQNHVIKVQAGPNTFHAVTVDLEEVSYLVKVKVKVDKMDKFLEDSVLGAEDDIKEDEKAFEAAQDDHGGDE
jgi:predicted transcriptional regulator